MFDLVSVEDYSSLGERISNILSFILQEISEEKKKMAGKKESSTGKVSERKHKCYVEDSSLG